MSKVYFNDSIVKTEKETTILNWFCEKSGAMIFIRDTRIDTYTGKSFIYCDVDTYMVNKDYYIDFKDQSKMDGEVFGFYISEGSDFEISTPGGLEPIFVIMQEKTEVTMGMMPMINKGITPDKVAMGMFLVGTTIRFKMDGISIIDELTRDGWKRVSGPSNDRLGVLTTSDSISKAEDVKEKERKQKIESLEYAVGKKEFDQEVIQALLKAKKDTDPRNVHIFLADDIKKLKKQGVL